MAQDIRETGPVGLKGLRGLNQQPRDEELEQLRAINRAYSTNSGGVTMADTGSLHSYERTPMEAWGQSQYDDEILNAPMSAGDIQDMRYENQPWYDTLANGIGKMLGTAGTTFVSSLVGLPYGLFEAANQGRWSALWDNDVTQGLAEVDKWLEENMTNYRSQVQQNSPWYSPDNLFSMNFIADDIIKNAGFTLGAAASMAVGSGSLGLMSKALGFADKVGKGTKLGTAALSALFSATGEGMIEARQGVEERNKLEMQRLDDAFAPEYQALERQRQLAEQRYNATGDLNTYKQELANYSVQKQVLDERKNAGVQQIEESGLEMGNKILLANQGLLTVGNLIQFGKGMVKSFDTARHAAEVSSKVATPFGVRATKAGADLLRNGYKIKGKNLGRAVALTKGLLTEGSEEMNQQWIQSSAGASVNESDVNDYWRAKLDPEAYRETTQGLYTMGSILDRGFQESWGDIDQWEQFVVGGLTGMAGTYTPTKLFNQDKNKSKWNPTRYGSWEGGAYNELRDFNREYQQYEENINEVNRILQSEDFPERFMDMVGHTYTETDKTAAAEANDKKAWKDADDKQFVHDIQSFLRAGKLDDLRAIYNEMGSNLSDEDIDNLVKNTTKQITAEEDKQNHDRLMDTRIAAAETEEERAALQAEKEAYVGKGYTIGAYKDKDGNQIKTNDEIREIIKHNVAELNRKLDSYLDSIDVVNKDTKGALSKDQEDNLAYLHHLGRESLVRADKIIASRRKKLPQKFLLKTDKTPEQLTQEYATTDLSFSKDENTKEGYVEVDTSLMDDRSFRNFFIGELLWGGNINPEFAETAEEKAAREGEEKNLSTEEKKKRAKERLSKKWKESLEKQKKDAEEQRDTNGDLIAQNFIKNYRKNTNANQMELQQALNEFFQDIVDASSLVSQAGEYDRTLREYMANPELVDRDKAEAEAEATKANDEQQAKNKFAGKDAKQIKQEVANGSIDFEDFDDFAGADLSGVTDDDVLAAQQEVKKAQEGNQKAASLKQHIQEQLGDNPTQEELNAAQAAMQMIDVANLAVDDPSEISIAMPELNQVPLDQIDPNASIEYVDTLNQNVQQMIADAFNALEEDQNAQNDIPEEIPSDALNDVEVPETGDDSVTKVAAEVVAPNVSLPSEAANNPIPQNPLTDGAIDTIIQEMQKTYEKPATNGTWRSTTTRHTYGKSTGTYHEDVAKQQYGEDSKEYKRSKAIWEYLNSVGAFDRQDNSSQDRIKAKDTVHFMVKYMSEVFGSRLEEVSDENKPYAMVILMLNDNGEVIGDLPLVELEPSYKAGTPTQQVKDLMSLQKKLFDAFYKNYANTGANQAIVDNLLHKEDADNLNLTFDNSKKPLVSRVKQVMKGVVPFRKAEKNTLNEVANGQPLELGVAVSSNNIAKKRGDKIQHKEVVMPHVGTVGQPYLLMPTPSGEQMAIPFYMVPFNAEQHRNTELYKILTSAIYDLLVNNSYSTAQQKEGFNKAKDAIEGLLQVKAQEGVRTVVVGKDNVTLYFQNLTDPNQKITITASNASGNNAEIAKMLVDQLTGIPINVSLQFLNDTIEAGGRKANYNNVIGEIADVNLPKATNHTVNGWFTVELAPSAGIKPSKQVTPRTTGIYTGVIAGRNVEIDADKLTATDTNTGEIIVGDEAIDLYLAQIQAEKPINRGKDKIKVSINGELKTYDVKQNKFVKNAPIKKETTATPQPAAEETPDVSAVTPSTSGTISFAEQTKASSTIEIDVPTTTGESRKERVQKVNPSELKKGDLVWYSGPDTDNPIGQDTILAIENREAWGNRGLIKSKAIYKVVFNDKKSNTKTIEQIKQELKDKKLLNRQNKDAWEAIPDDLLLKFFNEGTPLEISWNVGNNGRKTTIYANNMMNAVQELTNANMAAKANNLSVTEASKYREVDNKDQKKANIQRERRWLQQNLPMFNAEDRLKLIQGLIEIPGAEGWAWGRFQSGVITLSDMAAAGTTYHEAFHAVTQTLLDDEELDALYEAARERYKENDVAFIEELLAEDFRKYVQREETPIIGYIRKIFRRILHAMKNLGSYKDPINLLFYKINNGEFKDTLPRVSRGNNAFYSKYVGRVNEDLFHYKSNLAREVIDNFQSISGLKGDYYKTAKYWNNFRDSWKKKDVVVKGRWREKATGEPGWALEDILVLENGVERSLDYYEDYLSFMQERAQQHAAKQAREGRIEVFKWDRLSKEQQDNLILSGMSREQYESLSLEEKEQWVKCRA